jgi:hypothetical protein
MDSDTYGHPSSSLFLRLVKMIPLGGVQMLTKVYGTKLDLTFADIKQ